MKKQPSRKQNWRNRTIATLVIVGVLALGQFAPQQQPSTYHREDWPHWVRNNGSCQNTRTKLLISKSEAPIRYKDHTKCQVVAGKWRDAYTGRFVFLAKEIEVDHVVPLYYAHHHGGENWSRAEKEMFANDFNNLMLTTHDPNSEKSAKGPIEWRPPDQNAWCEYGKRWQKVTKNYQIIPDWQDQQSIKRLLEKC